jgi:hypothetical protein
VEPNCYIVRLKDIEGRNEIVPEDNFIQCNLKMEKGKLLPPHKHITKERTYQEQIAPRILGCYQG